jgi:hypothetical protein
MAISISNMAVSTKAAAGTVVGVLKLIDLGGVSQPSNFILDENSAGIFEVSGANLVTLRGSIPPGSYAVPITGNAQSVALSGEGIFIITVTAN